MTCSLLKAARVPVSPGSAPEMAAGWHQPTLPQSQCLTAVISALDKHWRATSRGHGAAAAPRSKARFRHPLSASRLWSAGLSKECDAIIMATSPSRQPLLSSPCAGLLSKVAVVLCRAAAPEIDIYIYTYTYMHTYIQTHTHIS